MPRQQEIEKLVNKYAPACVEFLQNLIQTPSVNGEHNEHALAEVITSHADEIGLPSRLVATQQERPNVYVGEERQFENPESIIFVAHGDTVPIGDEKKWTYPPFGGEIHDEKIYRRGAIDCKGGIALSMCALKILQELGATDKAKALIGADEESGADSHIGIRYVLEQGLKAHGAVYTYGGCAGNELTIGHRGVLRVWVECEGELAHSGSREWQDGVKGANAIDGINRFLEKVREYGTDMATTEHEYFKGYRSVITPTLIEGGSGESLVPDSARVLLDIRTLPSQKNEDIAKDLQAIADNLATDKLRFTLQIKNNVPAALSDPSAAFVSSVKETMQGVLGYEEITFKGSGPANEAHMLISQNIPTVVGFGPTGGGFHSVDEYADKESIERSLRFLVSLALQTEYPSRGV